MIVGEADFHDLLALAKNQAVELAELRRQFSNMIRPGVVEELDPQKGYRLSWGQDEQGQKILSPWYPHPEAGGANKTWSPLTKGQVMTAINPGGDPRQGFLIQGGFTDQFKAPSQSLDETVREAHGGKMREVVTKDGHRTLTLAGNETMTVTGTIVISAAGGGQLK